ncbi:MAG: excinuclease ABC subunit UvrC [Acidobacteriota bacterium]|jgi:excinuclease ABC subunit C
MSIETLRDIAATLPSSAGVYLFKDHNGRTIYVGKAKSIRDRIRSHLSGAHNLGPKQEAMLAEAVDIDFIVTDTDLEALALENSLIKQNKPRYNVLLRDDKQYPYLRMVVSERFPRLQYVRAAKNDGEKYFGPYAPASSAHMTQLLAYRYFGIRPCNIDVDGSWERPCLYYDIGECAGPCVAALCSEDQYGERVEEALLFLDGRGADLGADLEVKMNEAAAAQEYERAAHYRDLLNAVRLTARDQKVASTGLHDRDLFALHRVGDRVALQVFLMRRGIVVDRKEFFWDSVGETDDAELLASFLQQYYHGEQYFPPEVCVPFTVAEQETIEAWLRQQRGGAVHIVVPQRGEKKRLLELVASNAELAFAGRYDRSSDQAGARILQELMDLSSPPETIECVDISNTQGGEMVAALVRTRAGQPDKSGYKRFKIRGLDGPDDYRAIAQVVERHFRRVVEGHRQPPDLLLIDGGRGQLNAARHELDALGMSAQPVAGLAKEQEMLYFGEAGMPVPLVRYPEAMRLLQRVRDEAHRFAIAYHRNLRHKRIRESVLDDIPGIGPKRKHELLRSFGSIKKMRAASVDDLAAVVGPKTAQRVSDFLREDD